MPLFPASGPAGILATLPATSATAGTVDTALLVAAIPPAALVVGQVISARLLGVSSSNGTLIFKLHVGPLGTVADPAAWTSLTSAAQVTSQRAGFDGLLTVRSTGAGGTAQAEALGFAQAALLPTVVTAAATVSLNTTVGQFLTLSATCSFGTFTTQQAAVEAL